MSALNEKKLIAQAFEAVWIEQPDDLTTLSDLTAYIQVQKDLITNCEDNIQTCTEYIKDAKRNMEIATQIIDQYKVERYKVLNPGKEVY